MTLTFPSLFARRAFSPVVITLLMTIGCSAKLAASESLSRPQIGMLYWVGGNQLCRANLDGSAFEVLRSGLDEPDGLVLDLANNAVYWSNMGRGPKGSLQRARLDGSPIDRDEYLLAPGSFETGKEIELDERDGKLYWADRDGKQVLRANRDGSEMEIVLSAFMDSQGQKVALKNPVGIALDAERRQLYVGDRFLGSIMRLNLDQAPENPEGLRKDVEVLIEPPSADARTIDLDLDLAEGHIYWTDRGLHQILRARLDGSDQEVLVDQSRVAIEDPIGMSLDLSRGKMYWSDMTTHKIHRANLDGSAIEEIIGGEQLLGGLPYGPLGVQYKALEPQSGSVAGGTQVAVLGSHFVAGRTFVQLGEGPRVPATVINEHLLTFVTPPSQTGSAALRLITPGGESVLENAFRYR